jgi:hypothetical protein
MLKVNVITRAVLFGDGGFGAASQDGGTQRIPKLTEEGMLS